MNQIEDNARVDRLVRERWNVEETLTGLKAAVRRLLRDHASYDHMRAIERPAASSHKVQGRAGRAACGNSHYGSIRLPALKLIRAASVERQQSLMNGFAVREACPAFVRHYKHLCIEA
jgi:hypothetical protein